MAGERKRRKLCRSRYVQDRTRIDGDTVTSTTVVNDTANTNAPSSDTGDTDDTDTSRSTTLQLRQATATTTTRSTAVNPNTDTARSTTPQQLQQDTARTIKVHNIGSMTKSCQFCFAKLWTTKTSYLCCANEQ